MAPAGKESRTYCPPRAASGVPGAPVACDLAGRPPEVPALSVHTQSTRNPHAYSRRHFCPSAGTSHPRNRRKNTVFSAVARLEEKLPAGFPAWIGKNRRKSHRNSKNCYLSDIRHAL